jgi:hypothetical protein
MPYLVTRGPLTWELQIKHFESRNTPKPDGASTLVHPTTAVAVAGVAVKELVYLMAALQKVNHVRRHLLQAIRTQPLGQQHLVSDG